MTTTALRLVSLYRDAFDESEWRGFIVGESEGLVMIHQVSDSYSLDGYRVFRRADITEIEDDFYKRALVEDALRLKGQQPQAVADMDLGSMRSAMESAQRRFGALVLNREAIDADEVQVGTVRLASDETYVLRWLSPEAVWSNDDRPFRYADVTTLEFGSAYEETLVMVARDRDGDA